MTITHYDEQSRAAFDALKEDRDKWRKAHDLVDHRAFAFAQRAEAAEAECDRLREALTKINGWSEAHPHILGGIGVIARAALAKATEGGRGR